MVSLLKKPLFLFSSLLIILLVFVSSFYIKNAYQKQVTSWENQKSVLTGQLVRTKSDLEQKIKELEKKDQHLQQVQKELADLKNEDQYKINQALNQTIGYIKTTYKKTVEVYENLLKLKEVKKDTKEFDKDFTRILILLSEEKYEESKILLAQLSKKISEEREKIDNSFVIPQNVPQNQTPPNSGYQRQQVATNFGSFMVSIIAADINSTKVIVDTASEGDCRDNCPVLALGDYVSRNGAYAGINGSYFCPASYPSCAGKTNSFDTLLMNKNKVYFNSDNNVYSTVPAAIFGSSFVRFVGQSLEWGRDTGIDSMIANQPLLVSGGKSVFGGDSDPKKGSKGGRSFVANKGNMVYIGVVHNATVVEAGKVLEIMGMDNALNLDSGGSTALWFSGYKVGPGRAIPNAILFVRK